MTRKNVIIVKSYYPLEKDPRLTKLLKMLECGGYSITYMGWDRNCTTLFSSKQVKSERYKSIIMQASIPFGPKSFPFLFVWWLFVLTRLLKLEWDIVHVVNFPSIIPAIFATKLKNKLIVYDIEDTTADQLPSMPNFLRSLGIIIEKSCMKAVSAVILVDEMQEIEFGGIPNPNYAVIYDSPSSLHLTSNQSTKEGGSFKIFYAGLLYRRRHLHLESLIKAIKNIEGVTIILAGEGDLVEEIRIKTLEMPEKVRYVGWLPYDKVLQMSYEADLLVSLRGPNPLIHRYICGSKFLEALMCGKPILVNKGTSTAIKVSRDNCGIVVDAHNIDQVKEAILKLKDDRELCVALGMNGKKAYEQRYSWEIVQNRLLTLYSKIIDDPARVLPITVS